MRFLTIPLFVVLPLCVAAQETDFTKPILDKAVKAVGSPNKQTKLQGFTCQLKMTVRADENTTLTAEADFSAQGLDHYRGDLNISLPGGQNLSVIAALTGKKGWQQENNKKEEIKADVLPLLRADLRAVRLAQRPAYLRSNAYKLSPLGEMKIGEQDTIGIKVSQKDWPDVDLYFDKKSGLPVRSSVRLTEQGGNEKTHHFTFSIYKDFGGLKQFTRILFHREEQQVVDFRLSGVQLHESLDKVRFKQP